RFPDRPDPCAATAEDPRTRAERARRERDAHPDDRSGSGRRRDHRPRDGTTRHDRAKLHVLSRRPAPVRTQAAHDRRGHAGRGREPIHSVRLRPRPLHGAADRRLFAHHGARGAVGAHARPERNAAARADGRGRGGAPQGHHVRVRRGEAAALKLQRSRARLTMSRTSKDCDSWNAIALPPGFTKGSFDGFTCQVSRRYDNLSSVVALRRYPTPYSSLWKSVFVATQNPPKLSMNG